MKVLDLFKSNLFPDFKLLAGQGGLDNEICKVFILDTPDFCSWTRGGELVIGNGYAFHNNPDQFPVFLENLVAHNAAALGMKFDRFRFAHNYDDIIELANKYSFPLIEIPFKYTWNMIYDEIYKKNQLVTNGATVTSDLLSVIEERMDPLDLVYSLHAKIKREIFAFSNKLQLYHYIDNVSSNPDYAEKFKCSAVVERTNPHNLGGIAINTQSKNVDGIIVKYASYRICNIEICIRLNKKENVLPPRCEKLVINTLLLFYLMVMDEVLVIDSERQRLNSFLERLLTGKYTDPEMLLCKFRNMKLRFPLPCNLLFFYETNMIFAQREIQPLTPLNCLLGEQMVLIMSPKELEEKHEKIKKITEKNGIFGIYSKVIESMDEIATIFSEIRESMTWIKRLSVAGGFYSYGDILVKIGISRFSELNEASVIVKRYWTPLKDIPNRGAVSMEKFVTTLIDANFNLSKVAADLNVHYNTVRNYQEKLEKMLNIDIGDSESRFLVMLARYTSTSLKKALS